MLLIYRHLINILFPIIIIIISLRVWFKKEDKNRFKEKLFISSFNIIRNRDKKLIWFHVASIGELKSIIPLRGPVDKKTLSCNEGGLRKIANNDKFGFKNKNLIYKNKIKFFLIGDSFTHGECEDENTDIAGFLRNNFNLNAANYGISGG